MTTTPLSYRDLSDKLAVAICERITGIRDVAGVTYIKLDTGEELHSIEPVNTLHSRLLRIKQQEM